MHLIFCGAFQVNEQEGADNVSRLEHVEAIVPCGDPKAGRLQFTIPPLFDPNPIVNRPEWTEAVLSFSESITLVTGYLDLGPLPKWYGTADVNTYKKFMLRLGKIRNPMVFFVDEQDNDIQMFLKKVRSKQLTLFKPVKRSDLWAFGFLQPITQMFSLPCFPKIYALTTVPNYACTVLSKFEFVKMAIEENFFKTKYFAWMDAGYWRDTPIDGPYFSMVLPPRFNDSTVAIVEVKPPNTKLTMKDMVWGASIWIAGGFLIGRGDVFTRYCHQFMEYSHLMLRAGMMNSEEQVIYGIYHAGNYKPKVMMQLYPAEKRYFNWFTLGFMCKEEAEKAIYKAPPLN
ncbi:uncharacterized protein LOC125562987 [Nematostella vectensis]|uniref:uncharacterized protein LOC125562987 n=1 Tax=Nematostella vectensis TaxID=45351 RepID=UPI002077551C|nr:uncharacterized protein LOC125562987 [Nematostella vectensis]